MSEIRDRVKRELRVAGFGEGQINYVLGMREIAMVDRDAQIPILYTYIKKQAFHQYLKKLEEDGWVLEVKE